MSARNEPGCLPVVGYLLLVTAIGTAIAKAPQLTAWLTSPAAPWAWLLLAIFAACVVASLLVWAWWPERVDDPHDYCAEADLPPRGDL